MHPDSPVTSASASAPFADRCVRCGYSLRGLPGRHACPECGLAYDETSRLFRVTNPKAVFAFWMLIVGGGCINLKSLPLLFDWANLSTGRRLYALAGVAWILIVVIFARTMWANCRRGYLAAVVTEGVFVRLPAQKEELIPWEQIESIELKDLPEEKPQVARLHVAKRRRPVDIGGQANVLPDKTSAETFRNLVALRIAPSMHR